MMLFAFLSLHLQEMAAWMKNQEEAHLQTRGLPRWRHGKEPTGPCRRRKRRRFNPWVGKIPWRNTWQPTPAIIPWIEEPNRLQSMGSQRAGHNQSDLERSTCICYGPAVIFFCSYFRGLLAPRGLVLFLTGELFWICEGLLCVCHYYFPKGVLLDTSCL